MLLRRVRPKQVPEFGARPLTRDLRYLIVTVLSLPFFPVTESVTPAKYQSLGDALPYN